jgi:Protein of unknown function (DUF1214)
MLQLAVSQMLYGAVPSHDRVRLDLDEHGDRLHVSRSYPITFPPGTPPVQGFWSLTWIPPAGTPNPRPPP